jgi:hypothetical protein
MAAPSTARPLFFFQRQLLILKGFGNRVAIRVNTRQEHDPALRQSQCVVALPKALDAFFIAGQRLTEPQLTVFKLLHDLLQSGERLFKRRLG